jgi:hypothetical protein
MPNERPSEHYSEQTRTPFYARILRTSAYVAGALSVSVGAGFQDLHKNTDGIVHVSPLDIGIGVTMLAMAKWYKTGTQA